MRESYQHLLIHKEHSVKSRMQVSSRLELSSPANWKLGSPGRHAMLATAFLFALALTPVLASAQVETGTLRGSTTARNPQGQPIPVGGVAIKLTANAPGLPPQTAYSNEKGEFQLDNVPAGPYTLEVSVQGFKPVTRKITIMAG